MAEENTGYRRVACCDIYNYLSAPRDHPSKEQMLLEYASKYLKHRDYGVLAKMKRWSQRERAGFMALFGTIYCQDVFC